MSQQGKRKLSLLDFYRPT